MNTMDGATLKGKSAKRAIVKFERESGKLAHRIMREHFCNAYVSQVLMKPDRRTFQSGFMSVTLVERHSNREFQVELPLKNLNISPARVIARVRRTADREMLSYQSPVSRERSQGVMLCLAAHLLPDEERADWLEEQRGYLSDLPTRPARWAWIARQLVAMPRYAYTVRTGDEKESA